MQCPKLSTVDLTKVLKYLTNKLPLIAITIEEIKFKTMMTGLPSFMRL